MRWTGNFDYHRVTARTHATMRETYYVSYSIRGDVFGKLSLTFYDARYDTDDIDYYEELGKFDSIMDAFAFTEEHQLMRKIAGD